MIRNQALDPFGSCFAICNVLHGAVALFNEDMAAALCTAVNDWTAGELLDREPRLRASMVVPTRVPEMGAREIDRLGSHPGFVQVLLPVRSEAPYGHRRYLPIFEAATRRRLSGCMPRF